MRCVVLVLMLGVISAWAVPSQSFTIHNSSGVTGGSGVVEVGYDTGSGSVIHSLYNGQQCGGCSMSSGGTETFSSYNVAPGGGSAGYVVWVRTKPSGGSYGSWTAFSVIDGTSGQALGAINWDNTSVPGIAPCTRNFRMDILNNTTSVKGYQLLRSGVETGVVAAVLAGQTGTLSWTAGCGEGSLFTFRTIDLVATAPSTPTGTNSYGWGNQYTGMYYGSDNGNVFGPSTVGNVTSSSGTPSAPTPTVYNGQASPTFTNSSPSVNFTNVVSTSSNLVTDTTMQVGLQALYAAVRQADVDIVGAVKQNAIDNARLSTNSGGGSGSLTNYNLETTQQALLATNRAMLSNLQDIRSLLDPDSPPTNNVAMTNTITGTNWTMDLVGSSNSLRGFLPTLIIPSGVAPTFTIPFAALGVDGFSDQSMDFGSTDFGTAWATLRAFTLVIVSFGFVFMSLRLVGRGLANI